MDEGSGNFIASLVALEPLEPARTTINQASALRQGAYVPSQTTVGVNPLHTAEAVGLPWWVGSAWNSASLGWFQKNPVQNHIRLERALTISLRRLRCLHIPGVMPPQEWLAELYTSFDDSTSYHRFADLPFRDWNEYPEASPAVRLYRYYEDPYGNADNTYSSKGDVSTLDRMEMLLSVAVLTEEDLEVIGVNDYVLRNKFRTFFRTPNLLRALLRNPSFPLVGGSEGSKSPFERIAGDLIATFKKGAGIAVPKGSGTSPNATEVEVILSNPSTPRNVLGLIAEALDVGAELFPALVAASKGYLATHPNWERSKPEDLTLASAGMARPTFGRVYPSVNFSHLPGYLTNQFTHEDGSLDYEKLFTPDVETINAVGHFPAVVKLLLEADEEEVFESFQKLFEAATGDESYQRQIVQFVARHYPMLIGATFGKKAAMYGVSSDDIPTEWLLELMS